MPRVLLVEDDDAYRYVLSRELQDSTGMEVIAFKLALDALNHIEGDPSIKKAVVDLRMPENTLTGLGFARMMRYRCREARVVLLTGHSDYLGLDEAEPFGGVLFKESDVRNVVGKIHQRLELVPAA